MNDEGRRMKTKKLGRKERTVRKVEMRLFDVAPCAAFAAPRDRTFVLRPWVLRRPLRAVAASR
jgi:hypothetical protein